MIKAAFFDIDNTLYDWKKKEFNQAGLKAIRRLKKQGVKVFLASARPYRSQVEFGAFDLDIPWDGYIASAGAIAYSKGRYLLKMLMDTNDVKTIIAIAKQRHLTLEVVTPKTRFLIAPGNTYLEDYHGTYSDITPAVHAYKGGQCTGVLLFSPEEHDEAFHKALPHLCYFRFHPSAVDIMPEEHRKGDAIGAILDFYGIGKDEAISFGDDVQDISMRDRSFFVAMGNGKEEVKAAADYVCPPIGEDGLYKALVHLGVLKA